MGTVEHRLRALVRICGSCPMLRPCAVQLRLTTNIACHAVSDSPSTRPVRTSRSSWGRPKMTPDAVPAQPITSTADTDHLPAQLHAQLHATEPRQTTPQLAARARRSIRRSQGELAVPGVCVGFLPVGGHEPHRDRAVHPDLAVLDLHPDRAVWGGHGSGDTFDGA